MIQSPQSSFFTKWEAVLQVSCVGSVQRQENQTLFPFYVHSSHIS